jgi:hypothetical protein
MTSSANLFEAHRHGLSDKARYNFDSDMRQWLTWRGHDNIFTVADPFEVRDFVLYCVTTGFDRGPLKLASISHLLSSLASLHVRILEVQDPTKNIIVKGELKRLRREVGTIQDQAVALRAKDDVPLPSWSSAHHHDIAVPSIAKLRATCDTTMPRGLRDRVLLGLGEDLGRRNQDLHLFNGVDITRRLDGRGDALICRSKTDQRGEGKVKTISARAMDDVEAWKGWKAENAPDALDALLVGIDQTGKVGNRLSPSGINYVLHRIVVDAIMADRPDVTSTVAWEVAKEVSSHSFRVGLAQDGVAANEDVRDICDRGDWEQEVRVLAYSLNLDPASGAVARLRSLVPLR